MFCSKCGNQIQDGAQFCPKCGNKVVEGIVQQGSKEVKIMLDPSEVVSRSDESSRKTTSGHAGTFGLILMVLSIIFSLISMFAIGFGGFIPITIISTTLFVIGFLIRMFCP